MDSIDELDPDWWRSEAILSTRLRDLVANFASISSFAIPYARLPRRLGAYAEEFPRWADAANETPQALLLRPKLGAAAVRALIEAAQRAVQTRHATLAAGKVGAEAAVTRMIGQLDDFDRQILSAQVWALDPVPQHAVAERLGVHPVSVGRNLLRARARFAELLADPAHQEVVELANELRRRLGPYIPADVVGVELRRLGVDPSGRSAEVLLHLAGPYGRCGTWLENRKEGGGGRAHAAAAVDAVFAVEAAPSTASLLQALVDLGMPAGIALVYLEKHLALKRFGDVWVRWAGDTAANRAEAALHVLGVPATAEAILATVNSDGGTSLKRVNAVLSLDDRFVRASRSMWGLRAWGIPEYSGIAHAIGDAIDAGGGEVTVKEVVSNLRARYPDITESSIRSYVSTLEFITKRGVVRRRTKTDTWPPVAPLNTIRGAFRNGGNDIRVAIPVTSELLRGSGQTLHPAVVTALGVSPGTHRTFTNPQGQVTLSWKLASTAGAHVGSLRAHAVAVEATTGDLLVLAFRVDNASLEVTRLGSTDAGKARLHKLLRHAVHSPAAALAAALDCRREDVGAVLQARGDHELAGTLDGT